MIDLNEAIQASITNKVSPKLLVEQLVSQFVNLNYILALACQYNYPELAKECVEHGANNFSYALQFAVFNGNKDVIQWCVAKAKCKFTPVDLCNAIYRRVAAEKMPMIKFLKQCLPKCDFAIADDLMHKIEEYSVAVV